MKRLLAALALCLSVPAAADSQQLALSEPAVFLPMLTRGVENGIADPIWFYIAAIINGANTYAVLTAGQPVICGAPVGDDMGLTTDTIMRFVVVNDLVAAEHALFEIVIVLSHAEAFPCNTDWNV